MSDVGDQTVHHLGDRARFERLVAEGTDLTDPSLATEGFVHCSFASQLEATADRHFGHAERLSAITVDPAALDAELVVEDSYGSGQAYPHVYGPIAHAALGEIVDLERDDTGRWRVTPSQER